MIQPLGFNLESLILNSCLKSGNSACQFLSFVISDYSPVSVPYAHPRTVCDFIECRKLLEAFPNLRQRLILMADVSIAWSLLVDAWDELCEIMDAEGHHWHEMDYPFLKTKNRLKSLSL